MYIAIVLSFFCMQTNLVWGQTPTNCSDVSAVLTIDNVVFELNGWVSIDYTFTHSADEEQAVEGLRYRLPSTSEWIDADLLNDVYEYELIHEYKEAGSYQLYWNYGDLFDDIVNLDQIQFELVVAGKQKSINFDYAYKTDCSALSVNSFYSGFDKYPGYRGDLWLSTNDKYKYGTEDWEWTENAVKFNALKLNGGENSYFIPTYFEASCKEFLEQNRYTVSMYVKTEDNDVTLYDVAYGSNQYYRLYINEAGEAGFKYKNAYENSLVDVVSAGTVINDGEWHWVVGVRDDDRTASIWVDGVNWQGTGIDNASYVNVTIGSQHRIGGKVNPETGDRNFNGIVDEVRIYWRALTSDELVYDWTLGSFSNQAISNQANTYISESYGRKNTSITDNDYLVYGFEQRIPDGAYAEEHQLTSTSYKDRFVSIIELDDGSKICVGYSEGPCAANLFMIHNHPVIG